MSASGKPATSLLMREVTAIIRAEMGRHNVSKEAVAGAIGVSPQWFGQLLLDRKQLDVEQLDRIAWALGMSLTEVITQAEKKSEARLVSADWITPSLVH